MPTLVERLLAIHHSLTSANLRHAFGGAIALAYCTEEPRGTRDLDVNIFTSADNAQRAVDALPEGVRVRPLEINQILRDGQTRVWWGDTPIDLFLNNHEFHDEVAQGVRWVPLGGEEIPVLSCESLVIFKALFNRTKDWADIEAVAAVDPAIIIAARSRLVELTGDEDEVSERLARVADAGRS